MIKSTAMVDWARSQIGVKEDPAGSNNVKYNTWYYGKPVNDPKAAWCAVFLNYGFNHLGAADLYNGGKKTASCITLYNWAKKEGLLIDPRTAEPGDIAFFDWQPNGQPDHVGVVESRTVNGLVAIEGNSGDEVARRSRYWTQVLAVYRPKYLPAGNDRYQTIDEVPAWYRPAVQWYVDNKFLSGTPTGLDLTDDMCRILTVTYNAFHKEEHQK